MKPRNMQSPSKELTLTLQPRQDRTSRRCLLKYPRRSRDERRRSRRRREETRRSPKCPQVMKWTWAWVAEGTAMSDSLSPSPIEAARGRRIRVAVNLKLLTPHEMALLDHGLCVHLEVVPLEMVWVVFLFHLLDPLLITLVIHLVWCDFLVFLRGVDRGQFLDVVSLTRVMNLPGHFLHLSVQLLSRLRSNGCKLIFRGRLCLLLFLLNCWYFFGCSLLLSSTCSEHSFGLRLHHSGWTLHRVLIIPSSWRDLESWVKLCPSDFTDLVMLFCSRLFLILLGLLMMEPSFNLWVDEVGTNRNFKLRSLYK